jgi:hypothetical protein
MLKMRCAARYQMQPEVRYVDLGFRCAMDVRGAGSADPRLDSDGDGVPDAVEYQAGTDPANAASWLGIESVQASGAGMTVRWKGGTVATQYLEVSESLIDGRWRVIFTNVPPTSVSTTFIDAGSTNGTRFYRIEAGR